MRMSTIDTNTLPSYTYARTHCPPSAPAPPHTHKTHRVADAADGVARREARHPAREARAEVDEPARGRVRLARVDCRRSATGTHTGRRGARTVACDEHGHDEPVHGDDARHDDGDERLCASSAVRSAGACMRGRTFMMSSGLNAPRPAMPMPALDVPYAAPTAARRQHPPSCLPPTLHSLLNIICGGRSATAPGEQGRGTHRGRDACEPEERRPVRALRRDGHD
jgi:hypothetical protein